MRSLIFIRRFKRDSRFEVVGPTRRTAQGCDGVRTWASVQERADCSLGEKFERRGRSTIAGTFLVRVALVRVTGSLVPKWTRRRKFEDACTAASCFRQESKTGGGRSMVSRARYFGWLRAGVAAIVWALCGNLSAAQDRRLYTVEVPGEQQPTIAATSNAPVVPASADAVIDEMSRAAGVIFVGQVTAVRRPVAFGMDASGGIVEVDLRVDQAVRGRRTARFTPCGSGQGCGTRAVLPRVTGPGRGC